VIDPHGEPNDVIEDVPELSVDEVERRIGGRDAAAARRRRRAAATPHARIRTAPSNRRATLWRDSATILVGVVLALLAARFLLPGDAGVAVVSSPTPPPSEVAVGSIPVDTGFAFTAIPTFVQVVPTGLHIDATPTPIPVITLPPPTPTPRPSATVGPSPKPTVKPTPKPSTAPTAPPAPPVASFNCVPSPGYVLTCTDASINATGWVWHWGDGTTSGVQNPAPHTYTASDPNPIQVTLDVTGPGGSDSQSIFFTLIP
jgi:hypothetical protein